MDDTFDKFAKFVSDFKLNAFNLADRVNGGEMKSKLVWYEELKDVEEHPLRIRGLTFSPDGEDLIVAVNEEVRVYSAKNGILVQSLRAHKDVVTCVAYSKDGKRFATGSADKQVIIWSNKLEGILKYNHNDVISCLEYNPITNVLASCSTIDFGLWSSEQKAVSKFKVSNAISACCWSIDGQTLALAYVSGHISIRTRNGEERYKIERTLGVPIWTLAFYMNKKSGEESLIVFDYDHKLGGYDFSGKLLWPERDVGFDAQFIEFVQNGDFLLSGGSNRIANLFTTEGIFIGNLCEEQDSWIKAAKSHPYSDQFVIGTHNGRLSLYEIEREYLYCRYRERFVYRENLTDVVVQHLVSEEKVRIKCHSLVRQVALYQARLAIQLAERVIVYELPSDSSETEMRYKLKAKLNIDSQCNHMLIFSQHVMLFEDQKVQCYRPDGVLEREWVLDSSIQVAQPVGGLHGKESCLLGLQNGQLVQLFVHNQFPVPVIKLNGIPTNLDLSATRRYLAVTDHLANCYVYEFTSGELVYQELNANAVAWNQHFNEMLCFSGVDTLTIKSDSMTTYHQQIKGQVVAFIGCKVFLLKNGRIEWLEITQSVPMYQYMERKQFRKAYEVACLNVTEHDWSQLAHTALQSLELDVAVKAFQQLGDYPFVHLLHCFSNSSGQPDAASESAKLSLLGDVCAYRGQLSQAVRLYTQAGHHDKAVAMYSDLRMFDAAQELMRTSGTRADERTLAAQRARWASQLDTQPRAAAELAMQSGQWGRALALLDQLGAVDLLLVASRQIDSVQQTTHLRHCAQLLLKYEQQVAAVEIYERLGDFKKLASLYTAAQDWQKAFQLLGKHPELREEIYLPYATYLAENEQFVKAQEAFYKAGKLGLALQVLQQLTSNAVTEQRFHDASYYSWILSIQCLELSGGREQRLNESQRASCFRRFRQLQTDADLYYAYTGLFRYVQQPFTAHSVDALFNIGKFVLHESISQKFKLPTGLSRALLLHALAKQSRQLGAFKLARMMYEQLHVLQLSPRLQEQVELGHLSIRCKPFNDAEELLPLCYRCSTTNPLYNSKGNRCVNCEEPFVFSFISFDSLPLVRLRPQSDIEDEEAAELLLQSVDEKISATIKNQKVSTQSTPSRTEGKQSDVLKLDDHSVIADQNSYSGHTEYANALQIFGGQEYSREMLLQIPPSEVIILKWSKPLRYEFLRNLVPEMNVVNCDNCNKMFLSDEFESQIIQNGCCAFCRKEISVFDRK